MIGWRVVTIAAALVALLVAGVAQAETDIFGRSVPDTRGRITIIVYANHDTGESVQNPLADLSAQLWNYQPLVIVRVDLRDLPEFFRGFAASEMKKRFQAGLARYETDCQQMGVVPAAGPADRLYFVSEPDGHSHELEGLPKGFKQALAVAYAPDGTEIARAPFPEGASAIEDAVRNSQEVPVPSQPW
jgi:hypothetical protein